MTKKLDYTGDVQAEAETLLHVQNALGATSSFTEALQTAVKEGRMDVATVRGLIADTLAPKPKLDYFAHGRQNGNGYLDRNSRSPEQDRSTAQEMLKLLGGKKFSEIKIFLKDRCRDDLRALAGFLEDRVQTKLGFENPELVQLIHVALIELLPDSSDLVTIARATTSSHALDVLNRHSAPEVRRAAFAREHALNGSQNLPDINSSSFSPNKQAILAAVTTDPLLKDLAREIFAASKKKKGASPLALQSVGLTLNQSLPFNERPGIFKPSLADLAFATGSPVVHLAMMARWDFSEGQHRRLVKNYL